MAFPHTLRLLLAGILAIPALVLLLAIAPIIIVLSIPSLAILVRRKRNLFTSFARSSSSSSSTDSSGSGSRRSSPLLQHAVVTGGSSGIGLSIAIELAKRGCENVTILARREAQLADAKKKVEEVSFSLSKSNKGTNVTTVRTYQ
jgi:hypothetical protein